MTKLRITFLGLISALLAAPPLMAGAGVEIPVIDMRDATPQQAREKAQQMSENGVAILYLSAGDPPARAVQTVAGECAEGGFQVRALVLADPEADSEGMLLYGATAGPLGPAIPVDSNMKIADEGAGKDAQGAPRAESGRHGGDRSTRCRAMPLRLRRRFARAQGEGVLDAARGCHCHRTGQGGNQALSGSQRQPARRECRHLIEWVERARDDRRAPVHVD